MLIARPVRHRRRRRLHDPGRPVDHHHELRRGPQRNRALLVYAGTAAGGFSLGLVAGGLLTALGWRWVFFAPVILAAAILLGRAAR